MPRIKSSPTAVAPAEPSTKKEDAPLGASSFGIPLRARGLLSQPDPVVEPLLRVGAQVVVPDSLGLYPVRPRHVHDAQRRVYCRLVQVQLQLPGYLLAPLPVQESRPALRSGRPAWPTLPQESGRCRSIRDRHGKALGPATRCGSSGTRQWRAGCRTARRWGLPQPAACTGSPSGCCHRCRRTARRTPSSGSS